MKQFLAHITAMAAVIVMACACSIKEDRTPCPCWLKVFIDPFPANGAVVSGFSSSMVFSESVGKKEYEGYYETTVPRTFLGVTCVSEAPSVDRAKGLALIPIGQQSDSLYAHHATVDCTGEDAEDHARLHKQFATVYMTFENSGDGSKCPYDVTVRGTVDGMNMNPFAPHEGDFEFSPEELQPMFFQYRIPRQKDASLVLELRNKDDGSIADTLPLGQQILDSGFDWGKESLEDIVITVNLGKIGIEVKVSEWKADKVYDVTI